jgi:hypothetical protein
MLVTAALPAVIVWPWRNDDHFVLLGTAGETGGKVKQQLVTLTSAVRSAA